MAATSPQTITLSRIGDVWVITFQVNAISPQFLDEIHTALNQIEATPGASAVVFASAQKLFSGGVNLKMVIQQPVEHRQLSFVLSFCQLMKMMGRLVSFSIPTVAAIAGHCYAGGFLFICACDHRVMSDKNTNLCLNEVKLPLALPAGATRVLVAKLSPKIVKDMLLTGRNIGPQEALASQTVDMLAPQDQVLTKAVEWAQSLSSLGEKREAYGLLKRQMYGGEAALCAKAAWEYEEMVCSTKFTSKL
jgi:enoyl-CoA hydratase/carnithine racemase